MTSPKERLAILRDDANACLRKIALEKYGSKLAEEIIGLARNLQYEDEEKIKKLEEFPYTEFGERQDSEGKVWMGYNGSNMVKKVGLPMIVPDVYYAVREKLQKDPKRMSVEVKGPEVSNLFRPTINFEEKFYFVNSSLLRLFAQSPRGIGKVNAEIIEKKEFKPDFWSLDKYVGVGNMNLTPISSSSV